MTNLIDKSPYSNDSKKFDHSQLTKYEFIFILKLPKVHFLQYTNQKAEVREFLARAKQLSEDDINQSSFASDLSSRTDKILG